MLRPSKTQGSQFTALAVLFILTISALCLSIWSGISLIQFIGSRDISARRIVLIDNVSHERILFGSSGVIDTSMEIRDSTGASRVALEVLGHGEPRFAILDRLGNSQLLGLFDQAESYLSVSHTDRADHRRFVYQRARDNAFPDLGLLSSAVTERIFLGLGCDQSQPSSALFYHSPTSRFLTVGNMNVSREIFSYGAQISAQED